MPNLLQQILDNPLPSLVIVGNLIIIESLLSVDNAAVLATLVMDLKAKERAKALRYGLWGAYLFRGLAMLFASILIRIWWLKPAGGLYLIYIVLHWWRNRKYHKQNVEEDMVDKKHNRLYRYAIKKLGVFWATVVLVEVMDIAFSIDNVFAAVAFSPNIILVCVGVFIGIFAIRFLAQGFVQLMERYRFLESAAFIVIAILGIKLLLTLPEHFFSDSAVMKYLSGHGADVTVSILTVLIFVVPLLTSWLFNFPRRGEK